MMHQQILQITLGLILFLGACGAPVETIKDVDGHVYQILEYEGVQWMTENLKTTKTKDGTSIQFDYPNDDPNLEASHGLLYDYETACKVCPAGWELPNNSDWEALIQKKGGEENATAFKEKTFWGEETVSNETGFSVRPAGGRNTGEHENFFGEKAYFWSKNRSLEFGWTYIFEKGQEKIRKAEQHLVYGFAVRCIKRDSTQRLSAEEWRARLDTIFTSEQVPIRLRDSLMKAHGVDSKEAHAQNVIAKRNHAINEQKIKVLLEQYGWPGVDLIGERGSLTICNVIQHSANEVREFYLPMMKKAVMEQKLHPRFLARAKDRIATEKGELQIYGGQIKYYPETKTFNVWPIFDPANVDQRRAEIGLEPISDFLKGRRFPIEWNLEEQLKRTEIFEKEGKNLSKVEDLK